MQGVGNLQQCSGKSSLRLFGFGCHLLDLFSHRSHLGELCFCRLAIAFLYTDQLGNTVTLRLQYLCLLLAVALALIKQLRLLPW